jgi:hypothetical protein
MQQTDNQTTRQSDKAADMCNSGDGPSGREAQHQQGVAPGVQLAHIAHGGVVRSGLAARSGVVVLVLVEAAIASAWTTVSQLHS